MTEAMKPEHIDGVTAIEEECFKTPWSRESLSSEIAKNKYYFVARCGAELLGYCGMWHIVNEGHITNVAVRESARGRGIGDKLIAALQDKARELEMIGLTLEVSIGNYPAQRLYTRNGFKPEGIRKNYYEDTHEDAVIMWKYF